MLTQLGCLRCYAESIVTARSLHLTGRRIADAAAVTLQASCWARGKPCWKQRTEDVPGRRGQLKRLKMKVGVAGFRSIPCPHEGADAHMLTQVGWLPAASEHAMHPGCMPVRSWRSCRFQLPLQLHILQWERGLDLRQACHLAAHNRCRRELGACAPFGKAPRKPDPRCGPARRAGPCGNDHRPGLDIPCLTMQAAAYAACHTAPLVFL